MTATAGLAIATPTDLSITMTRSFAAPRERVFDAWTQPELLRRWFGPRGHTLVECDVDLRVGGCWRYVVQAPDGTRMLLRGAYREVVRPERLVATEENVDCDASGGAETVTTTTFVEQAGGTLLTTTQTYPSRALRDAVLRSGMERGVGEAYEQLAEALLAPAGLPG
jgi:uncharacterized protein YndB with AHSA1/START domain